MDEIHNSLIILVCTLAAILVYNVINRQVREPARRHLAG